MRVARLELFGFKSFPSRTVFEFDVGISCVVGPNGCGKSNVVDAVRWCIGEQSAKSLRGSEMQDVIFAGSTTRNPVGYAEVVLTFTADGGAPFPGDYVHLAEISVGRRLHRSGASEYLINGVKMRRRDVVDLFLDTGVGNNLYSFIEQGRIDKIVSASDAERRSLIDEAAGISRYKAKREEARSRLEATAGQLDRAADVADEMGRRIQVLERQVVRAAKFRRLRSMARQDEVFLAMVQYSEHIVVAYDLEAQAADAQRELKALAAQTEEAIADLAVRSEELNAVRGAVETWRGEVSELDGRRRELVGAIQVGRRRAGELAEQLNATEAEEKEGREVQDAVRKDRVLRETAVSELTERLSQMADAVSAREEVVASARSLRDEFVDSVRELERKIADRDAEIAGLRARKDAVSQQIVDLGGRITRVELARVAATEEGVVVEERASVAAEALLARSAELATCQSEIDGLLRQIEQLGAQLHHLDGQIEEKRSATDAIREQDQALVNRIAEISSGRAEAELVALVDHEWQQKRAAASAEASDALSQHLRESRERVGEVRSSAERQIRDLADAHRSEREIHAAERIRLLGAQETRRREEWTVALASVEEQASQARRRSMLASESVVTDLREQRADQLDALSDLQEVLGRTESSLQERREHCGMLSEDLAALEAAAHSRAEAEAGSRAVWSALPDAPSLAEHLGLDAADTVATVVLGDLAALPVVGSVALVLTAASASKRAGPATLMFSPSSRDEMVERVTLVESLPEALERSQGGRTLVVRGTGERVEPGGLVRLGDRLRAAEAIVDAASRLPALRQEVVDTQGEIEALHGEQVRVRRELATTRTDLTALDDEIAIQSNRAVSLAEAAADSARMEARQAVEATRLAHEAERRDEAKDTSADELKKALEHAFDLARKRAEIEVQVAESASTSEAEAFRERQVREEEALRKAAAQALAEAKTKGADQMSEETDAIADRRAVLAIRVQEVTTEITSLQADRQRTEAGLSLVRVRLDATRAQAAEHQVVLARLGSEAVASNARAARLVERLGELDEDQATLQDLIGEKQSTLDDVEEALEATMSQGPNLESTLREENEDLAEANEAVAEAESVLDQARDEVGGLREKVAAATALLQSAEKQVEAAVDRVERARGRRDALRESLSSASDEVADADAALAEATEGHSEAVLRLDRDKARLVELEAAIAEVRQRAELATRRRDALVTTATECGNEAHRLRVELAAVAERLEERYQVDLSVFVARCLGGEPVVVDPVDGAGEGLTVSRRTIEAVQAVTIDESSLKSEARVLEAVARLEESRAGLAKVGEVNLTALDEYRDLVERHDELGEQRRDLEESVTQIRGAIAKMNRVCRERFRDTFDRVNEHFQATYPELFGGGSARLSLTDDDDLLETGVAIFVRPPGKRLQNPGLLSGGEKAMTALALLLALFRVKPSPFCILDEVDAPLDEANGTRFNEILRRMAKTTQFIVITHNRTTMECGDALYGVTMPTPGCSGLVSVQVGDDPNEIGSR